MAIDYNGTLGTEGVKGLCRGLRTNGTLKQLHLCYTNMDSQAGIFLNIRRFGIVVKVYLSLRNGTIRFAPEFILEPNHTDTDWKSIG